MQPCIPPQVQTPKLQKSVVPEQAGPPPQVHLPLTQPSVTLETQLMAEHESGTVSKNWLNPKSHEDKKYILLQKMLGTES